MKNKSIKKHISRNLLTFSISSTLLNVLPQLLIGSLIPTSQAFCQERFEGINNSIDKKRRNPVITVKTSYVTDTSTAKIIVDSYIPNTDFEKYPVKFEYFINKKLFTSQIRNVSTTGDLGIDVGPDIAPVPFAYSIVATLLHPNRQYITVAEGTVSETNSTGTPLEGSLGCTLTISNIVSTETPTPVPTTTLKASTIITPTPTTQTSVTDATTSALQDSTIVTSENASALQSSNSSIVISFEGVDSKNVTYKVNSNLLVKDLTNPNSVAGDVTLSNDIENKVVAMTGTITKDSADKIISVDLISSDENSDLICN